MSDALEFIKSLTIDATQDIKSYVHYNVTDGTIFRVTSRYKTFEGYEVLEVPHTDVKELMSGKKRVCDYRVEYDSALKQLKLKEQTFEDLFVTVSDKLYKIPANNDLVDLRIQYDQKENYWRAFLDPELRKNKHLIQRPERVNLHFSITAKNDPNILYASFHINLREIIDNDFFDIDCQFEFDPNVGEVSIYTAKYFDSYAYEHIQ